MMLSVHCRAGRTVIIIVVVASVLLLVGLYGRRNPVVRDFVSDGLTLDTYKTPVILYPRPTSIALGCAITTQNLERSGSFASQISPFFNTFLSSFCKTATPGYDYHIYIAYDTIEKFLTREQFNDFFGTKFHAAIGRNCSKKIQVSLHFVDCGYTGHPAWAQNDALLAAYLDHRDYYFRVSKYTNLTTPGWTEKFISTLAAMDPPNIGVVGASHRGGRAHELAHEFVHRTHFDIFGFHYPRTFSDWYADAWITQVYLPDHLRTVEGAESTWTIGEHPHATEEDVDNTSLRSLKDRLQEDRETLGRYIEYRRNGAPSLQVSRSKYVISMSLYGNQSRYTYGAIRNANLAPLIFPGWKLRFYMEDPSTAKYTAVPENIFTKLRQMGVEMIFVNSSILRIPPMFWRFLVADDTSVDYFIVRDIDSRLSRRDATLVNQWVKSGYPFHCVRDHPSHGSDSIFGGLWGGQPKELQGLFAKPFRYLMRGFGEQYGQDLAFLRRVVWPQVEHKSMCHDSTSCKTYPMPYPIKEERKNGEHIGQVFDGHEVPRAIDLEILFHAKEGEHCRKVPRWKRYTIILLLSILGIITLVTILIKALRDARAR